jgi:hypothetical protein
MQHIVLTQLAHSISADPYILVLTKNPILKIFTPSVRLKHLSGIKLGLRTGVNEIQREFKGTFFRQSA